MTRRRRSDRSGRTQWQIVEATVDGGAHGERLSPIGLATLIALAA